MKIKLLSIIGTRPQFIKSAAIDRASQKLKINHFIVDTGQHYSNNMSSSFIQELGLNKIDYCLNIGERSSVSQLSEIMKKLELLIPKIKPDYVIVYGDTNSTLGGALAASKIGIPICHVEAGLRSFNKTMPEEINRKLTDHLSEILFCPTIQAMNNLKKENIHNNVYHVGDIMFDAVKKLQKHISLKDFYVNSDLNIKRPFALLTIHREATLKTRKYLNDIIEYSNKVCDGFSIIFPIHPRTKKIIHEYQIDLKYIKLIDPQSYLNMQSLIYNCEMVLTDSGGLQKEAYFHKKRCITLRDETEWTETISHGWNRIWTDHNYLCEPKYIPDYGDGLSSEKMFSIIKNQFLK